MSVTFSVRKSDWQFDEHDLNLCNSNARMVLETLGQIPTGEDGTIGEVADLTGFIEMCDAVLSSIAAEPSLDPGREAVEYRSPGRCTVIDCGVRPGYLQEKVTALRQLAVLAKDAGGVLCWG